MTENTPENHSQIGLLVETTEYSMIPGGSVTVSVVLVNEGEHDQYIELAIGGIPTAWHIS